MFVDRNFKKKQRKKEKNTISRLLSTSLTISEIYFIKNDRLIILNTLMHIRARSVENCGSYICLIGNGRRFYVSEARESYHP